MMEKELVYFPGCLATRKFPGFDFSTRFILGKLNIDFKTSDDFTCCPDPVWVRSISYNEWTERALKNIEISKKMGSRVVTICNGCFETLYSVKRLKFQNGDLKIEHLLYTLWKEKKEEIKNNLVRDFKGKKFAIHEGCHFRRPTSLFYQEFEELKDKNILKEMVELLGAEVIDKGEECCGLPVFITDKELSLEIANKRIESFGDVDGIVVICPSCFTQFENAIALNKERKIPVYFYFELLAYALGLEKEKLGIEFHRVRENIF